MEVKRNIRSEQKRKQIVDAAGDLFISNGYFETSMDDIAQRADVSKQTVYAHFGSKDDLFTYCVEHRCAEIEIDRFDFTSAKDAAQQLLTFCLRVSEVMQSAEALYVLRLCISQADSHPQLSKSFYTAGPGRFAQILCDGLSQLALLPQWNIDCPQMAAEQLMVLTKGMVGIRRELGVGGNESDPKRIERVTRAVEMFVNNYRTE
ncbi:TetR/AcrR family transcriptional regulator [Ferrimonas lipolytica]|uniref:TetR/AcrR family transcriptional regulator n=1 Tax=Ferrimonas lipolytica TaxID=2724191 RepID=A0A6H1UFV3_9GAMM|nr:TetR/AcrR family transcriptional regulator [Ferrimonas lipolytica]QIZ77096.1 TetR/AcrR family transcriptional regulator [Ferrimonas lipolytica]